MKPELGVNTSPDPTIDTVPFGEPPITLNVNVSPTSGSDAIGTVGNDDPLIGQYSRACTAVGGPPALYVVTLVPGTNVLALIPVEPGLPRLPPPLPPEPVRNEGDPANELPVFRNT
nr:hypothetical protein [Phycisphaerales bacterium]